MKGISLNFCAIDIAVLWSGNKVIAHVANGALHLVSLVCLDQVLST
ncbi:hypothetical protein ACVBEF_10335 [Glaciimonas sp. GG7]